MSYAHHKRIKAAGKLAIAPFPFTATSIFSDLFDIFRNWGDLKTMGQAAMKEQVTEHSGEAYDQVPYESYSYPQTHPPHLATIGTLFGMKPADLKTARVLELGCASGGNLFPLAVSYPDATFVGIDLSEKQIEEANQHTEGMGLSNISFKAMDITKLDKSLGEFDYIIVHGVYSWVPDVVRDNIMRVCRELMSEQGLAVISYNTLPGWAAIKSIRDMMLYHTAQFGTPAEKATQAKQLLQFLYESTPSESPYNKLIEAEKDMLDKTNETYLLHDHLEEENTAFYLHDFVQHANSHDLIYVGDVALSTMFAGNLPPEAMEKLQAIKDIVRQEQYMDFVRNRRFRHTILCKKEIKLKRAIGNEDLNHFYISANFQPNGEIKNDKTKVTFENPDTKRNMVIEDPATKAFFSALADFGKRPATLEMIKDRACEMYDFVDKPALQTVIEGNVMNLVLKDVLTIGMEPAMWVEELSEKPKASPLATYMAKTPGAQWVTSLRRERVSIDPVGAIVLLLADGTRTIDDIAKDGAALMKERGLNIKQDDKEVTDLAKVAELIKPTVEATLNKALKSQVLVG
jgi:methyltransferase-like protein/2-polyprenyl-3-methyl-5-hydroxy-6-metoxy-1,4-benzoquinol methylase